MAEPEGNRSKGSLLLAYQTTDKHCLVIGSGEVALSRILHLIVAKAKITVVAGESTKGIHPEIVRLHAEGHVYSLVSRDYQTSDLTMYESGKLALDRKKLDDITPEQYKELENQVFNETFAVVCCCIDDYDLSTKIYYQCKFLRLPVNIADKPPLCDFYFGSMFNQDNLQIMISTNGKSPRLSKMIKDSIAKQFKDVDLNSAVENLGLIRSRFREKMVVGDSLDSIETRMTWIKEVTDFFNVRQWSELNFYGNVSKVDKIIDYFPGFPPRDFATFKGIVDN